MSQLHHGFHVRRYQPWKLWVGLMVVINLMVLVFYLGNRYQALELERLQLAHETLMNRVEEMKTRNHKLVEKNAHLKGSSKIERDAYQITNRSLVKMQQQLLAQKEELAFYQGIVSPKGAALGVNLQSFEVRQKGNQNQYRYKMILTKNGKSTKKLKGAAHVVIRGESGGSVRELKMTDLLLENQNNDTKFAFRYFQVFQGDLTLPDGFEPFEVEIGIISTTKKVKSFSETISWARVLSAGV